MTNTVNTNKPNRKKKITPHKSTLHSHKYTTNDTLSKNVGYVVSKKHFKMLAVLK